MAKWLKVFRSAASDSWPQSMVGIERETFSKETRAIVYAAAEAGYSIMPDGARDKVYFCRSH